ncbi:hypothetical protein MB46_16060 [Arthrobacter alpinus]|nr:hypothetical protein MB46_16060 [Arthrobacter alpinus]
MASLVASGETSEAAIGAAKNSVGTPRAAQKFLSDDDMPLGRCRLGRRGALVGFLKPSGVEPITGKPYKPTTQSKN